MNPGKEGRFWEQEAAGYLRRAGVVILEQNFRCSRGEIDLIGYHRGCLVFFEVKYRRNDAYGTPQEAVDARKRQRILLCARVYRYQKQIPQEQPVRFDVIAIQKGRFCWIRNAFDSTGRVW